MHASGCLDSPQGAAPWAVRQSVASGFQGFCPEGCPEFDEDYWWRSASCSLRQQPGHVVKKQVDH